nr:immunoglobulin light chain junction region [Macaca mulatta]MOW01304.1 immunoglobulin light chain junction region [Macaca mulatta]
DYYCSTWDTYLSGPVF